MINRFLRICAGIIPCFLILLAFSFAYAAESDLDGQIAVLRMEVKKDRRAVGRLQSQLREIAKEKALIAAALVGNREKCVAPKQSRAGRIPNENLSIEQEMKQLEKAKKRLLKQKDRLEKQLAGEQKLKISHE